MQALAFFTGAPGIGEIAIIALVLVLLFGARKLPELARALGASLNEFKKGQRDGANAEEAPGSQAQRPASDKTSD